MRKDDDTGRIVTMSLEEIRQLEDRTDWARVMAMTEEELERSIAEDRDAQVGQGAVIVNPPGSGDGDLVTLAITVDRALYTWLSKDGRDPGRRISALLKAAYDANQEPYETAAE